MHPKHIYIAVAVIIVALIAHAYIVNVRSDRDALNQIASSAAPLHAQAQQTEQQIVKAEQSQKALTAADVALIARQQQAPVVTPVDYDRVRQMIQDTYKGLQVSVTPGDTPDAPSSVQITGKDAVKQVRNFDLACSANLDLLNSCNVSVTNEQHLLEQEKRDHETTKGELKKAREIANGGSFKQRFGRSIINAACGSAGSVVGLAEAKKESNKGGVVAGVGVFGTCELLMHLKR